MKKTIYVLLPFVIFFVISCSKTNPDQPDINTSQTFKDPRDGQVYNTVKIGNQIWMKENLNYATSSGSWCADCDTYGRLYDWQTAQTVAPPGWHLPSETEWGFLIDHLGGYQVAGGKMKTTTGWLTPNLGADNSSGFSGLAAGMQEFDGTYHGLGYFGVFWTTNESVNPTSNGQFCMINYSTSMAQRLTIPKITSLSVRCIKD